MPKKKRSSRKRKAPSSFNKYAKALKLTKGKSCNRKRVLKAVKRGDTPTQAVRKHCR